jgi:hypothetical protein
MSDSWILKDLADELRKKQDEEQDAFEVENRAEVTGYAAIVVRALDCSLRMIGRTGVQVIDQMFYERYGLKREDVVFRTGAYMSALKDMLGSSASVLERAMLVQIEEETGLKTYSIEEAVQLLKELYPQSGKS